MCWFWFLIIEVSPGLNRAPSEEPETEHPSSVLDAPEFPDFENSEIETAEGEAVDIGALELEALNLVNTDLPVPYDCGGTDFEDPLPDLPVWNSEEPLMSTGIQDLDLGSQNIIPLDPESFPEPVNISEFSECAMPEQWSQSEELSIDPQSNSQADETDLGAAESHSSVQEMENGNHVASDDGIQAHSRWVLKYTRFHFDPMFPVCTVLIVFLPSSVYQQDSYYEACDNIYEDVENINKSILGHNLRKRKGGLKSKKIDFIQGVFQYKRHLFLNFI